MSITTLSLIESLLLDDLPAGWWGLDTADPTADDSGHGYTLTAIGAPANAASLHTRGDGGASGCRDFNGSTGGYFTAASIFQTNDSYPEKIGDYGFSNNSGDTVNLIAPYLANPIRTGDLMLAILAHGTAAATITTAPAGWTQIGSTVDFTQGAMAVYKRTADATDELHPTYTWVWSATAGVAGLILAYRGCDSAVAALVFDAGGQGTASGTLHTSTTETHPPAAVRLALWASDGDTVITPNPVGATEVYDLNIAGRPFIKAVEYQDTNSGSGSEWANTTNNSNEIIIAIIQWLRDT